MSISINKLKFDIQKQPVNAATAIFNKNFVPEGVANKNGWEETKSVINNIKLGVSGLYSSVLELARDIVSLGKGNDPLVINIYKTVPEDVKITVNSILELESSINDKTGFFKNDDESMQAQTVVLTATDIFDKVRVLTMSMMLELQEIAMKTRDEVKAAQNLTNPNVVSDVQVKE